MNEVSIFLDQQKFELAQRSAKALACSTMVPKEYQNNVANVLVALDLAARIGSPPMLVMQNLHIIHGKPGWSAKYLIGSFNACGRFSPMEFIMVGEKGQEGYGCYAKTTDLKTGATITGPEITIAISKAEGWMQKSGSKWRTIPDLMLRYRAGAWLVNTVAPEISLGLLTAEEAHDIAPERDITPRAQEPGVLDINQELGLAAPQQPEPDPVLVVDTNTGEIADRI